MKILFISNHFSLPHQPGAPRPWKVAQHLHSIGHDVTVITNKRHYLNEKLEVGGASYLTPQIIEGVRITGVATTAGRRKSLVKRLVNYFSFSYMSFRIGLRLRKPDIIIVGTPPLLVPITGLLLGFFHGAHKILEIRDLYPETAVALGKLRNRFLESIWEHFENTVRRFYDQIIPVVPQIGNDLLRKGFEAHKITTITNGFDMDSLDDSDELPQELNSFFEEKWNKFMVVYGGGMGYAINLFTVIHAAELLKENEKILFVFFGEGERKKYYLEHIRTKQIPNCFFFAAQPRNVIHSVFRRASVLVHSFINRDFFKCGLPNKIFEYHAAGRPIIYAGVGDTADLVRKAGSGLVVKPEDPKEMADAILYLAENPEEAMHMGHSGRKYIMKHYRREVVFKKWDTVLSNALT